MDELVAWQELRSLLEERVAVIGDLAFRDRDAVGHLGALRSVSERIERWRESHSVPPKLRHFLENASYQKAWQFVSEEE